MAALISDQAAAAVRDHDSHLAAIRRNIQTDPTAKAYFEGLVVYGETLLAAPSVNCTGLTSSRWTLSMEYNLGLLWRLTGDKRCATYLCLSSNTHAAHAVSIVTELVGLL